MAPIIIGVIDVLLVLYKIAAFSGMFLVAVVWLVAVYFGPPAILIFGFDGIFNFCVEYSARRKNKPLPTRKAA